MRKFILLFSILFLHNIVAQDLKFDLLKTLTTISFVSVDEYMIYANGFKKVKEENNGKMVSYVISDKNIDNLVYVKVASSAGSTYNALEVLTGKNTDLSRIIRDILKDGYVYFGDKNGMYLYKKDNKSFLIRENFNEVGANQIIFMFGE